MSGRQAVAPCGHTGEVIIGTYVRCEVCDPPNFRSGVGFRPYAEVRAAMDAQQFKGWPQHVRDCACGHCKHARRVCYFDARTKDGRTAWIAEWYGQVNLEVKIIPHLLHADLAGWRALDGAGDRLYFHPIMSSAGSWDGGFLNVHNALLAWFQHDPPAP